MLLLWEFTQLSNFSKSPVWSLANYLDSWTWHSSFLGNIVLYSIRLDFHQQSHPQLDIVFTLAQPLHSFWNYFSIPLFSISILGTYQPREFIFQCLNFLSFHTVPGVLKARILKCFTISFSRLYFLGLQNHCRWWLLHEIKRHMLLGRKAITYLDSILK